MKYILLLGLLACCGSAFAQGTLAGQSGDCTLGGQQALTQGLPTTGTRPIGSAAISAGAGIQASYPNCQVAVYLTGTLSKAGIFSNNNSIPGTLANPFTANGNGSWTFFVAPGFCYDIVVGSGSGPSMPSSRTYPDVCIGTGTGGGVVTPPGGSPTQVQFNDGTTFGGSPLFTFDETGGIPTVNLGLTQSAVDPDLRMPGTLTVAASTNGGTPGITGSVQGNASTTAMRGIAGLLKIAHASGSGGGVFNAGILGSAFIQADGSVPNMRSIGVLGLTVADVGAGTIGAIAAFGAFGPVVPTGAHVGNAIGLDIEENFGTFTGTIDQMSSIQINGPGSAYTTGPYYGILIDSLSGNEGTASYGLYVQSGEFNRAGDYGLYLADSKSFFGSVLQIGSATTGISRDTDGSVDFGNGTTTDKSGSIKLANLTASGSVNFSGIVGSTQCLHVDPFGAVSGTGSDCGSGGGSLTGSGTTNKVAMWTSGTGLGNSPITYNGTNRLTSAASLSISPSPNNTDALRLGTAYTSGNCLGGGSAFVASPGCYSAIISDTWPSDTTGDVTGAYFAMTSPTGAISGTPASTALQGTNYLQITSGTAPWTVGLVGVAVNTGLGGTATNFGGVYGQAALGTGANVVNAFGVAGQITNIVSAQTQPFGAALMAYSPNVTVPVSHIYGLYIQDQTAGGGTNNPDPWGIFEAGTARNQLGGSLTLAGITGSTQCLHVNAAGLVSGTGSDCGSGGGSGSTITINGGSALASPTNFQNSTGGNIVNGITITFSNPTGANVQAAISGSLANAGLANSSTTVNLQSCVLGSACTIPEQVNNSNLTSQAGFNLLTSTVNSVGVTIAPTNTGTNQVEFRATGIVNASGGGTGISNPAAHTVPVAEGSGSFNFNSPNAAGNCYMSNGTAADPSFQTCPSGFANPMTTVGDMIVGGTAGAALRLPVNSGSVPQTIVSVSGTTSLAYGGTPVDATNPPTLLQNDRANFLNWTSGSAMALPAVSGVFASNFTFAAFVNSGSTLVFTPNAATSDLCNGASTCSTLNNFFALMYQDSTSGPGHWFLNNLVTDKTLGATCANGLTWNTSTGIGCLASASGTVTTISTGSLAPLFTASITNPTTTPALSFTLSNATAGTVFGNPGSTSIPPVFTSVPVLGVDNTTAGTLQLANSAAAAHTIFGSGATTSNTINGFATVPTTGHLIDCTVTSTTCLLHDSNVVTANVVNAFSPGAGIGHFAGSTQTLTSSPIVAADITNATITHTQTDSTFPTIVGSGTAAMGTGAITSGTCATVVTVSASGVATTDTIKYTPNTDPTAVTGYGPSASGSLYIWAYPTANNVNFKVCNNTAGSITPSALTLNWQVAH